MRAGRRQALRRTRTTVSTVLLDMGGVVIPTLFESTAVPGFPAGPTGDDAEYRAVEQGREQERDYWARLARRRPDIDIGALWRDCSYVRAEVVGLLRILAGRVRVVAFTNDMAHWFGPDWPARFPAVTRFDAVLEAAKLGVLKPDPEAFRAAADALGEDPAPMPVRRRPRGQPRRRPRGRHGGDAVHGHRPRGLGGPHPRRGRAGGRAHRA